MNGDHTASRPHVGVVINPERRDETIIEDLERAGCQVSTRRPDSPDDLAAAISELIDSGVDVIAAVGGDGTQRTTAAALIGTDIALAVVPGGTVNLLANVVGTPEIGAVADAVVVGNTRRIDLARLDDQVFVLNASTGFDASVMGQLDDRYKKFGRLGITVAGAAEWRRSPEQHVTVVVDGSRWYDGAAHTVLVMNVGNRASPGFELAADARLDDGLFDILVFRRHSLLGLARAIWAALRGRELPSREVENIQAAEARVTWDEPVPIQIDGDPLPDATTTTYTSLPGGLRVITAQP